MKGSKRKTFFFRLKAHERDTFPVKIAYKRAGKGLDYRAEPPCINFVEQPITPGRKTGRRGADELMPLHEHTFHVSGFYVHKYLKRRIDQEQTTSFLWKNLSLNFPTKVQYVYINREGAGS